MVSIPQSTHPLGDATLLRSDTPIIVNNFRVLSFWMQSNPVHQYDRGVFRRVTIYLSQRFS